MIKDCETVGVTAGASAPEILVEGVVDQLRGFGGTLQEETNKRVENVAFSLPPQLKTVGASEAK